MAAIKAPVGLSAPARRFWTDVLAGYELRRDELRLLEDTCRELDIVDRLQAALAGAPLTVAGSQGQQVPHPLLGELRQHRLVLARLLAQLKLPADDEDAAGAPRGARGGQDAAGRSARARRAARARWGTITPGGGVRGASA